MSRQAKALRLIRKTPVWKRVQRTASYLIKELGPTSDQLAVTSPYSYKFLDVKYWIRANVNRAIALNLDQMNGLRILDIGTGAGMFPLVCRALGHQVFATDIPKLSAENALVYPPMRQAVGLHRIRKLYIVNPTIRLTGTFDLICAHMICFGQKWGAGDWQKFAYNMKRHLNPGGRLALTFNTRLSQAHFKMFSRLGSVIHTSITIHNIH
jgi:SAM-dependent methyltransferase